MSDSDENIDYKAFFRSFYDPDMQTELQESNHLIFTVAMEKLNEFIKEGKVTPAQISKGKQLCASMLNINNSSDKNNSNSHSVSIKRLPKNCIHFNSKYQHSSTEFINYVTNCLTNTEFCCNAKNDYPTVSCFARVFCLQCCLEFVICTKKFELILLQMQKNLKILSHYQNIDEIFKAVFFQSIHIVIMLEAVLANNTICKYFCTTTTNKKNIIILLKFLKQLYIIASKYRMSCMLTEKFDPFSRMSNYSKIMSNLIFYLLTCMKKQHWKYLVKLELPQLFCDIICSDIFIKPHQKNENIYQIFEYPFVSVYIDIMLMLRYKYSSRFLLESNVYNRMIEKLGGYSEQTGAIYDQVTIGKFRMHDTGFFDVPHVIKKKINTKFGAYRKMGKICANTKCRKYKPTETHIQMQRKFKKCSGCLLVLYCGRKCQKYHWKYHSRQCVYLQNK